MYKNIEIMKIRIFFKNIVPIIIVLFLTLFLNFSFDSHTGKKLKYSTDKKYLLGKINPSKDSLFTKVNIKSNEGFKVELNCVNKYSSGSKALCT